MKKLLCLIVSLLLLFQSVSVVFAGDFSDSVSVNVDLSLKENADADYINGPLSNKGTSVNVDLKADLEMSTVFSKFVEWYQKGLNVIDKMADLDSSLKKTDLVSAYNATPIDGEFIVSIYIPKSASVPSEYTTGTDMYGFNDDAKTIFYEKERTLDEDTHRTYNVLNIKIGVKDTSSGSSLTVGDLDTNKSTYLKDMTYTIQNIGIAVSGTHNFKGTMTGYTQASASIAGRNDTLKVTYSGVQKAGGENPNDKTNISATVKLGTTGSSSSVPAGTVISGSASSTTPSTKPSNNANVKFDVDGKTDVYDEIKDTSSVSYTDLPIPEKEGYKFDGWYLDEEMTQKVEGDIEITDDTTLYAKFSEEKEPVETKPFGYIKGYPNGEVRPNDNITREEVAAIFYRLMDDETIASLGEVSNTYTDVSEDSWSVKEISTVSSAGLLKGYEDNTFGPENFITRAEFATIVSRFASLSDVEGVSFADVEDHWAKYTILMVAKAGWINGYEDGTFRPDSYITRAEAMAIINRMMNIAAIDENSAVNVWSDISESDWFYEDVLKATSSYIKLYDATDTNESDE